MPKYGRSVKAAEAAAIFAERDRDKRVSPRASNHSAREIFTRKNLRIALQKIRPCKFGYKKSF